MIGMEGLENSEGERKLKSGRGGLENHRRCWKMVRMGETENGEGQVCWDMVGVKGLKNSGSIVKPHKAFAYFRQK